MSDQLDLNYRLVPDRNLYNMKLRDLVLDESFYSEFSLKYQMGLSIKSICRSMGVSPSHVYKLFYKFDAGETLTDGEIDFVRTINSARLEHLEKPVIMAFNSESLADYRAALKRLALLSDDYIEKNITESTIHNINADLCDFADKSESEVKSELDDILAKINGTL